MFAHSQRRILLVAIAMAIVPSVASAGEDAPSVTASPAAATSTLADTNRTAALLPLKHRVETVQEMVAAGELTAQQGAAATERYLTEARDVVGGALSYEQLLAVVAPSDAAPTQQLTRLQQFAGLITAVNILWAGGAILGLVGVVLLFTFFLKAGPQFWEVVLYLASCAFLFAGWRSAPGVAEYLTFTGALGIAGAIGFTWYVYLKNWSSDRVRMTVFFGVVAVVEALLALGLHHSGIGFLAVMALMGALGFSVAVIPFGFAVGWEDEKMMERATNAAFAILIGFVLLKTAGQQTPLVVFESGAYFMGAFVGFLGLLIMASRWYTSSIGYGFMQAIMLAAGVAAIVVGSVLHIGELQKIGGTFLGLWFFEKLAEIPAKSAAGYGVLFLFIAGVLSSASYVVKHNLSTFAPYIVGL